MEDDLKVTGIDENPPAQQQQAPGLDAATVAAIAAQAAQQVVRYVQPQQQAAPQQIPSTLQAWRANQISNGADAAQVDALLLMMEARDRDKEAEYQQNAHRAAAAQWDAAFWARINEQFEDLAGQFPAITKALSGLQQDVLRSLKTDSRFTDINTHLAGGGMITKPQAKKVVAHVADEFLKQMGVTQTAAPISAKTSAPSPSMRTTGGADKPVFLDPAQERFYLSFRGELGEEKARELARNFAQ